MRLVWFKLRSRLYSQKNNMNELLAPVSTLESVSFKLLHVEELVELKHGTALFRDCRR